MEVIQGRIIISQPRQLVPVSRNGRGAQKCSSSRVFLPIRGYAGNQTASVSESHGSDESCSYEENPGTISVGKEAPPLSLRRPVKRPKNQLHLDWQEGAWVQELTGRSEDGDQLNSKSDMLRNGPGRVRDWPDTSMYHQRSDSQSRLENSEDVAEGRMMRAQLRRKVSSFVQNVKAQPKMFLRDADVSDLEKGDAENVSASLEEVNSDIEALFPARGMREMRGLTGRDDQLGELWIDEGNTEDDKNVLSSLEPGDYVNNLFAAEELESADPQIREPSGSEDVAVIEGDLASVSKSWEDTPKASMQLSKVFSDRATSENVSQALFEWAQKVVNTLPTSGGHIMRKKMNVQDLVGKLARVDQANISAELDSYSEENGGLSELTASMVVVELCRTGKAKIAMQVLDWLSKAGIQLRLTSYNSLLAGLVRGSWFEEAYDVFEKMKSEDVKPSVYSYTLLMQVASRTRGYKATLRIFNEMVKDGRCKPDVFAFNCLIAAFGRAHKWKEVAQIWEKMKQDGCKEGMGTYCLLVSTFVRCDQFHLTLEVYSSIIRRAWKPNKDIFKALVCSCAKEGRWMLGLDFLDEMLACGIEPPATVFNALLSSMAKAGETKLVFRGYECMRAFGLKPDPFTWCSLLSGLNHSGEYDRAWKLFDTMKDMNVKPTSGIYAAMLTTCLKQEGWQTALRLVWEMEKAGLYPDVQIFTLLIKTCEASAQAQVALEVYEHMRQVNVAPNCFTYASLIRVCGKVFDWHRARELFEELIQAGLAPNVYVYNALFHAYLKCGQINFARKLYWEMLDCGCAPDNVTRDLFAKYPAAAIFIK